MMMIIKFLSVIALICSIAWFIASPDFEPAIATITSLSTLIGIGFVENKRNQQSTLNQTVGNNGVGIQSGGDVNVGSILKQENTKNAK